MSFGLPGPKRSEIPLTVLKKSGGKWSETEVGVLRVLSPLMHGDDSFPEYLILRGSIPEEQVAEYLLVSAEEVGVSITHMVGMDNPSLPFEVVGVR
jgi:hypothetical protein